MPGIRCYRSFRKDTSDSQSLAGGSSPPPGAGNGLVTGSGLLSGGSAHARSSIATAPSSASSHSCTYSAIRSGSRSPMYWTPSQASPEPRATSPATPRRKPCTARNGRCDAPAQRTAGGLLAWANLEPNTTSSFGKYVERYARCTARATRTAGRPSRWAGQKNLQWRRARGRARRSERETVGVSCLDAPSVQDMLGASATCFPAAGLGALAYMSNLTYLR